MRIAQANPEAENCFGLGKLAGVWYEQGRSGMTLKDYEITPINALVQTDVVGMSLKSYDDDVSYHTLRRGMLVAYNPPIDEGTYNVALVLDEADEDGQVPVYILTSARNGNEVHSPYAMGKVHYSILYLLEGELTLKQEVSAILGSAEEVLDRIYAKGDVT